VEFLFEKAQFALPMPAPGMVHCPAVVAAPWWAPKDWRSGMLVITRREGEEVVIGDPRNPIGVVRIASIKGDRVRLAFDFPRQIDVHRREVANQIINGSSAPATVVAAPAAATQ
jgi:carbon storage regulator